ncbi:EscI/YscI/HrpB family type III secretion system inner rod protein [Salmonella enterica]|nr:EscI/YscI/HrpB family type III secretion system inner rod protein [Salmonella enterica]
MKINAGQSLYGFDAMVHNGPEVKPSKKDEEIFYSVLSRDKNVLTPEEILIKSMSDYQANMSNFENLNLNNKKSLSPDDIMAIQSSVSQVATNTEVTTKILSLASTSLNKLLSIQ